MGNKMDNDIEINDQTTLVKPKIKEINKPNKINYEANYFLFFIIIFVGFNVMIFSTLFLPLALLFPFYYVSLFSTDQLLHYIHFLIFMEHLHIQKCYLKEIDVFLPLFIFALLSVDFFFPQ